MATTTSLPRYAFVTFHGRAIAHLYQAYGWTWCGWQTANMNHGDELGSYELCRDCAALTIPEGWTPPAPIGNERMY